MTTSRPTRATVRPPLDDLRPQFGVAREILEAMHIVSLSVDRYEADDLLGTPSLQARRRVYNRF